MHIAGGTAAADGIARLISSHHPFWVAVGITGLVAFAIFDAMLIAAIVKLPRA